MLVVLAHPFIYGAHTTTNGGTAIHRPWKHGCAMVKPGVSWGLPTAGRHGAAP